MANTEQPKKKLVHVPDQFKGDDLLDAVQSFFYVNYPSDISGYLGYVKWNYRFYQNGESDVCFLGDEIGKFLYFFNGEFWLNRLSWPPRTIVCVATVFIYQQAADYIVRMVIRPEIVPDG